VGLAVLSPRKFCRLVKGLQYISSFHSESSDQRCVEKGCVAYQTKKSMSQGETSETSVGVLKRVRKRDVQKRYSM